MTKEEKIYLKELKAQKDYDRILRQFGQKEFIKSVDKNYKKQDIAKLKKEGKYEDIFLRYGKSVYNSLLNKIKQREIEEACGKRSMKAISHKISYKLKSAFAALLYSVGIIGGTQALTQIGVTIAQSEEIKSESRMQYEEIIENYEANIKKYAENIKNMGLTDLEIFMKLQDDIHNSILGYGDPKLDIAGYFGADIGQSWTGVGVCRNMADDMARKLNAINPDYNARMIIVRAALKGDKDNPDINKYKWGEPGEGDRLGNETQLRKVIFNNELLGNHAVVAVDIKEENTTLIIDPTNICIGVFKDGEITLLNTIGKEAPWTMYRTPLDDFAYRGLESLSLPSEYVKSFLNPFVTIDELNEKYGVKAQNVALAAAKTKEEDYIYNKSKNEFKSSIKVNLEKQESNIYSMEEIEKIYNECLSKVNCINTPEEALDIANKYRKLQYSIIYYDNKQDEILGKPIVHYDEKISSRMNLNMRTLNGGIAQKLVETNAVILPKNDDSKQLIAEAYLDAGEQIGSQDQIQDLKIVLDEGEKENKYYILNNNAWLKTVIIENNGGKSAINASLRSTKEEDETKRLLENSISIIQSNTKSESSKIKNDNNKKSLDER